LQVLTEVADYVEVILPDRVEVVLDDLSSVNFTPLSLSGKPLHLQDDLAVGLVTA
jgi:hypothetical protein